MILERVLSPGEAALAATGCPLVVSCRVHGDLDVGLLRRAVDMLPEVYPVLAGRITAAPAGFTVRVDTDAPRPALLADDGFCVANVPFFATGELVLRATVRRHGDGWHTVALTAPHALCDGTSMLALNDRLWRLYTALATSGSPDQLPAAPRLAAPVEEGLRARYSDADIDAFMRERAERWAEVRPEVITPHAARDGGPGPDAGMHLQRISLTSGEQEALGARARKAQISLHAMIGGLLLTAIRTLIPEAGAKPLSCMTPVDLRPRVLPPLPPEEFVYAVGTSTVITYLDSDSDPVEVGQHLHTQLREDIATGRAEREIVAMTRMVNELTALPATVVFSNVTSVTRAPILPPGLHSERLHGLAYPPAPIPTVFATRVDGLLALDLVQPRAWYTREQADALAGAITDQVARITALEPCRPQYLSRR